MKVDLALPTLKRDLRLDLFRGLANWAMFLGHVSTGVLGWFSFRNYGFSDGADLFLFISGYTSALVFGKKMLEGGFVFGTTRLLRRVWQIYVAHVLLFVFYLASVHFLSNWFNAPDFIDRFHVAPLLNAPVETITQGLLLRYKPLNLDVLPLYVVLMGAFPPVLWLMLRHRNWGMLGSVLLYFAARQFGWNLPSLSVGGLVFQPVRVAAAFCVGRLASIGRRQYAAFPGALEGGLGPGLGVFALCSRHDVGRALTGASEVTSARSVRSLQSERQDQSGALSLPHIWRS